MAIKVKINPDVFKNHISALEAKKTEMLMDALQITQAVFNLDGIRLSVQAPCLQVCSPHRFG